MVYEREARAIRDLREHRFYDFVLAPEGEGHPGRHHAGPGPGRDVLDRVPAARVGVIRDEKLVAG